MATWGNGSGESEGWKQEEPAGFEQELALEDDDRLPWLESDEEEEPPAFDTGRVVGLVLIMVAILAALVGSIWYFTHRGLDSGPPADGSLIAAPPGPFKVRPSDAGGKTFAGTGDTSFAVGEGKTIEGRLAPASPDPAAAELAREAVKPSTSTPASSPRNSDSEALPAGTAVQVGAYSSRADAQAGWRTLNRQTEVLSGLSYHIVEGQVDIGHVYRLQAVGGDHKGAVALCQRLKADGVACQVK